MAETIPKSRLDEMVKRLRLLAEYSVHGAEGERAADTYEAEAADAIEALSAKVAWLQDADRVHLSAKLGMEKRLTERAEAAESSLASVTAERDALATFAKFVMAEGSWQGADIDGGTAQDKAEELGLIRAEPFDPEKHGINPDFEPGQPYYVFALAEVSK